MAPDLPQSQTTCNWQDLLGEIQYMILGLLAEAEHHDGRSLAGYARVSRDWQPVFEKLTFGKLRVMSSEVEDLQAIFKVTGRRKYLQHLGFALQLPKHQRIFTRGLGFTEEEVAMAQMMILRSADFLFPGLVSQQEQNNVAFTKAICSLFRILGTWTQQESYSSGIGLEIIADSESYWQDIARRIRTRAGPTVVYTELPRAFYEPQSFQAVDVPPILWEQCLCASEQDFHFTLDFDLTASLISSATIPKVHIITGLSILRKTIRHFEPRAIGAIIEHLPLLTELNWEFWPRAHWMTTHAFDKDLSEVIPSWPLSLKRVRIARQERFYYPTHTGHNRSGRHNPHLTPLGSKMTCLSQQLTHLSIEYRIDVHGFFTMGSQQCLGLQQLVLRSNKMILHSFPGTANRSLKIAAAHITLYMPKLRFFALYTAGRFGAECFSYEVLDGVASIGVRSNRPFQLDEDCSKAWQAVASEHCKGGVRWSVETLPVEEVRICILNILKGQAMATRD